ncbi:hypothetical protein GF327_03280 [Candidatus Woesearchaeota archaeon]|nr:hypothetical protein [Candidatus Woesearchaeota archaeon]
MGSTFREAITFLDQLGIYEVVLPFLLVFTTVYAILEKSKIFGVETVNDIEMTRKNLNSMFAFVTAFLVVASTQMVSAINEAVANIALLMLLGVCFLLLVGVFHTGEEEFKLEGVYLGIFSVIMFVGTILIFLNAIKTEDGTPWLLYFWQWIVDHIDSGAFGALLLTLFMVGMMMYITSSPGSGILGMNKKEDE